MSGWLIALGLILIVAGCFEFYRVRKYMNYLKTDAGSETPAFTLQAVWTSAIVAVIAIVAGIGSIILALSGTL